MAIREPIKVGKPIDLIPEHPCGVVALSQCFRDPRGEEKDFFLLHVAAGAAATVILPITSDGNVVAIRQFRYGIQKVILEIPGGNPAGRQRPKEVALSELLQETGFHAERIILLRNTPTWFDPALWDHSFYSCLAVGCEKIREPKLDAVEFIETTLIPLRQWVQMITTGKVRDAKSIVTTFLALPRLDTSFFSLLQ